MKLLPIGIEDFKKIIEKNLYYVDKTSAISLIEKANSDVLLFTRPRRFGKTLFISMLDYFYNIENKEENKKLFKDLDISKSEYMKMQGSYPTISITMKDIRANDFKGMLIILKNKFRPFLEKIDSFKNTSNDLKEAIEAIRKMDVNTMSIALQIFTEAYYKHYNKKVILLIDEYEAPILYAHQNGYVDETIKFFSNLYSSVLKTNPYLEKSVITGITKITQSNIFSGLNNIMSYGIDSIDFANSFGFTNSEVFSALSEYKLEKYKDGVKEYYDGYVFGNTEIYNPWSILNFLYEKKLKPYWTMTSSTEMIRELLAVASNDIKQDFAKLAEGRKISLRYNDSNNLIIKDLDDPNKLFAYMLSTGYLTYTKDGLIKIVNKEILSTISDISAGGLYKVPSNFTYLMKSLDFGDLDGILKYMNSLFDDTFSYMDMTRKTTENAYHMTFLILLNTMGLGKVTSNLEAGSGRYDIILRNFNMDRYSYVFEVKVAQNEKEIESKLDEGLEQIKKNNYIKAIDDYSKKMIVCFCFYKKEIHMKFEKISD